MSDINLGSDFLNYIVQQGFQPGDRLPSIQELTNDAHLDMSANKVREQLEVARTMGWVEVRSKRGTRIKDYSFTPAVRLSALYALACGERFESFASLRNHVETAYWNEACALLRDDDLDSMQAYIDSANEKLDSPPIHIPQSGASPFPLDRIQAFGQHLCPGNSGSILGSVRSGRHQSIYGLQLFAQSLGLSFKDSVFDQR